MEISTQHTEWRESFVTRTDKSLGHYAICNGLQWSSQWSQLSVVWLLLSPIQQTPRAGNGQNRRKTKTTNSYWTNPSSSTQFSVIPTPHPPSPGLVPTEYYPDLCFLVCCNSFLLSPIQKTHRAAEPCLVLFVWWQYELCPVEKSTFFAWHEIINRYLLFIFYCNHWLRFRQIDLKKKKI